MQKRLQQDAEIAFDIIWLVPKAGLAKLIMITNT